MIEGISSHLPGDRGNGKAINDAGESGRSSVAMGEQENMGRGSHTVVEDISFWGVWGEGGN